MPLAFRLLIFCVFTAGFHGCSDDRTSPMDRESLIFTHKNSLQESWGSSLPHLSSVNKNQALLSYVRSGEQADSLFFRRFTEHEFSPEKLIVTGKNWFVNWADFPSVIAFDSTGNYLCAHWLQYRGEGKYDYDVRLSISQDGGDNWGESFVLHNDGIAAEHGFVSLQSTVTSGRNDPTPRIRAVWLDGRFTKTGADKDHGSHDHGGGGAMTLRTALVEIDGSVSNRTELDHRICDCCQSDLLITDKGSIAVYRDRSEDEVRDIYFTHDFTGAWSPPASVYADNWQIKGCPVNGPAIAGEGKHIGTAWFTQARDTAKVQFARWNDKMNAFGPPVRIDAGESLGRVGLTMDEAGNAGLVWLEMKGEEAEIRYVTIDAGNKVSTSVVLGKNRGERSAGFPQITKADDDLVYCYTEVEDKGTRVICGEVVTSSSSYSTLQTVGSLQVEAHQPVLPVLIGKKRNKVLVIGITSDIGDQDQMLESFNFSLEGTSHLGDIKQAELLYSEDDNFSEAKVVGAETKIKDELSIVANQNSASGKGKFWLSLELNKQADLSHKIAVRLVSIRLSNDTRVQAKMKPDSRPQRIGIALRQAGDDGVNTYRIPGLVTTNKGTLLGVYDVRYNDPVDLQENIDVGLSRSTDGGQTWEEMKIIMDMGTYGGLSEDENGIGDPAILVDDNTNTIWVAGLWLHGYPGQRAWNASGPGMTPKETGQFVLVKSEDDGQTWSKPINVTLQMKNPDWQLFFNGPGRGITLRDGTLVFAAQYKDENRIPHSTIVYSKDGGKSWQVGTGAKSETTEAQVVELTDGSLMLNMRDDRNRANRKDPMNGRSIFITKDLGQTWTEHPTSRKALQESNCMASLIGHDHHERGKILFFSNPDSKVNRNHITIKTSIDEGMTWPLTNQLELYEEGTYGYSCMTMIDEEHIGILYEGIQELYFEKISLSELFDFSK